MHELHCPACNQPGVTSIDRAEVQLLVDTHNGLLHKGHPVATIRRRVFARVRAA